MTSTILVTGGTGTLGRAVVPLLREAGVPVRVLTRHPRPAADGVEYVAGDLVAGTGVEAAVAGVDTILHLAGGQKGDDVAAATLVRAAAAGGVKHIVHISVIGADRMPLAWMRMKLAAEEAVRESGVPWTILRAAQFHSLILTIVEKMAKLPVVPAPKMRAEPVDARDVAVRLVELALGDPAGLVPDLAGPQVFDLADLLRGYLRATGRRRPLLPLGLPGAAGRAYKNGENLAGRGADRGARTWEAFLAERVTR
ncbi:MAG: SDR family oxidoreductase [Hamadaea sp.]|nr:SDR family oxidoreductase [Hamadaea sp.]